MGNIGSVTGSNYWRDPESPEAHEARHKEPYREKPPGECRPEGLTSEALDACAEPETGPPTLFRAAPGRLDVDIDDIGQREIGDCYLLAALGALTRSEEGRRAIRGMILENRDAAGNVLSYAVGLYRCTPPAIEPRRMARVEITVSATLPFAHASTERAGVPGNRAEVWVAVIEKAYAELKGGFEKTRRGAWPGEAFEALTGKTAAYAAGAVYTARDLARDLAANKPLTLSTTLLEGPNPYGLVGPHAYAIVGSRVDAHGRTCLLLKNPWGRDDPKPLPIDELPNYCTYVDAGEP
jgi:hypothetical protein